MELSVPVNKNQHFVPKCYMKPFTSGGAGKAISLLNIDQERFIDNAPVKSQCSSDYFYGTDDKLEQAIQHIERSYAAAVKEILQDGYELTDLHATILKTFWLLQTSRTEAAAKEAEEQMQALSKDLELPPEYGLKIKEAVQLRMKIFAENTRCVNDLKVCLLKNKSNKTFITSDNPAVMTNQWHLSKPKSSVMGFGLQSAGVIAILPLSPYVCMLAYDSDIHKIESKNGWFKVKKDRDVEAINQFQFLECDKNIYFSSSECKDSMMSSLQKFSSARPPCKYEFNYAYLESQTETHKIYKASPLQEAKSHETMFVHSKRVSPKPLFWPSFIKKKALARVYTNDTGAGYVRFHWIPNHNIHEYREEKA